MSDISEQDNKNGSSCSRAPTIEDLTLSLTLGEIKPKIVKGVPFLSLLSSRGHYMNFFAAPGVLRIKIYNQRSKSLEHYFSIRVRSKGRAYLYKHTGLERRMFDVSKKPDDVIDTIKALRFLGNTKIKIDVLTAKVVRQFLGVHGVDFSVRKNSKALLTETLVKTCYPILRDLELNLDKKGRYDRLTIPTSLARNIREIPDIKKFTRRTFRAYSRPLLKDMIRRLSTMDLEIFRYPFIARGFLNHDELTRVFAGKRLLGPSTYAAAAHPLFEQVRKLLSKYPKSRAKHLLIRTFEADLGDEGVKQYAGHYGPSGEFEHLVDAAKQYFEFESKMILPEKPKSAKELHDEITIQYRKLSTDDYEFEIDDKLKEIDGKVVEGLQIVVPKSKGELIEWGTRMHNCIGSYAAQFRSKQTVLLGVKQDGKLIYNIEIREGRVVQFMKDYNSQETGEIRKEVEKALVEYKLIRAA